ncbi:MAG: response regulator receiver modulated metal-depenent phosphohydrolase [bacterium]|nr:MAG: response regulator receiver modulated metal-depenent phosphohydrolase [bacterium]
MNDKILIVDDDPDILETFKRNLGDQLHIDTMPEGEKALKKISDNGPYAVIVSDMRMPGMDGVQFLSKVRVIAPDSVRIMLTGNADQETAKEAVNEGRIFRFLTKPCPSETFIKTLTEGIREYQLVTAERELMEKTLSRSVKVLIDILSMVNPLAFSRSLRMRRYVQYIVKRLKLKNGWRFELAALLSQIGCVTIPAETLEKFYAGQQLTDNEMETYNSHPKIGCNLLVSIPRIELIARMIEKQRMPFSSYACTAAPENRNVVSLGAQLLKVADEFDQKVGQGESFNKAVEELLIRSEECDPLLVENLRDLEVEKTEQNIMQANMEELDAGMILVDNVVTNKGLLLVHKGQEVTYPIIELLKNYSRNNLITGRIPVIVPRNNSTNSNEKTQKLKG